MATIASGLLALTVVAQSPSPGASGEPEPSAGPGAASQAPASDPRCDPFVASATVGAAIGRPVTSLDFFDRGGVFAPLINITCTWRTQAPLHDVYLDVSDLLFAKGEPPFLIQKYEQGTPIADLGQTAYSLVENGSNLVAWEIRFGKTERTLLLNGYTNQTEALVALAKQITADAQPGPAPAAPSPGAPGASGADLSALYGTWLLTGDDKVPEAESSPPVTVTLAPEGTLRIDVACKPAKKSKAPSLIKTYTATATTINSESGWNLQGALQEQRRFGLPQRGVVPARCHVRDRRHLVGGW